jgi:hypothetical protein
VAVYYPRCRVALDLWGAAAPISQLAPDVVVDGLSPISATVEKNAYSEADTASVSLPYERFPVDPRALRDVRVRIWLGDVGSVDGALPRGNAPLFVGYADEPPLERDEEGSVLSLQCRDYTAIALDTPWGRQRRIRCDRPLDAIVRDVFRAYPTLAPLAGNVVARGTAPVPGAATARGRSFAWRADGNVWEALSDLAARVAWTLWFEGESVVLSPSEAVYGEDALLGTPQLVWGENLARLTVSRKLTRERVGGIEVLAYNTREGKVYRGRHPRRGEEYTQYRPAPSATWSQVRVTEVARQVHELLRRQQMEASFETQEMQVGGHDLVALRHGRAVRIAVDPELEAAVAAATEGGQLNALLTAGYDPAVARVLAENWRELVVPWQVRSARHEWSQDTGYRLSADLIHTLVVEPSRS